MDVKITEAKASAKDLRISAQKARMVMDLIRGKKAADALAILNNTNKKAARLIEKVLNAAVANATNNFNLDANILYIKDARVDEGKTLKRHRFGSRTHIDRNDHRTSHIKITVAELNKEV